MKQATVALKIEDTKLIISHKQTCAQTYTELKT